ncbi:hypothetical protein [Candidatus Viadribacter manganicus]|uniref:DoxX family protein n=1 Tax=Candidatus Viadribacter manganicus TaxID=1759059 RepID=A0A1B1ALZ8_9PROT|nr:hypothetical protein [Candidatus Viadribacter manganicus]ANP47586.1 hypothetical protein ATE48_17615 [Candidatus Viadribacter manganicus]
MKYFILWVRIAFGAHSLISGSNYFFDFLPQPPTGATPIGPFIDEMDATGLFAVIKVVETLVGVCLLTNRFVPIALVAELPISITIFYLSTFVTESPRSVFTGPRELFYNTFLLVSYAGYYVALASALSAPKPLWAKEVREQVVRNLLVWK